MVITQNSESVAVIDRRTCSVLLASAAHAKAAAELFAAVGSSCADGVLTDQERHLLQVECLHLTSIVTQLQAVIG